MVGIKTRYYNTNKKQGHRVIKCVSSLDLHTEIEQLYLITLRREFKSVTVTLPIRTTTKSGLFKSWHIQDATWGVKSRGKWEGGELGWAQYISSKITFIFFSCLPPVNSEAGLVGLPVCVQGCFSNRHQSVLIESVKKWASSNKPAKVLLLFVCFCQQTMPS